MTFFHGLLLSVVLVPFTALAQDRNDAPDGPAKSQDELKSLFGAAYMRNSPAALAGPYHLFASFQTFDPAGAPAGDGSIERFFVSPSREKTVTRFRGHTMTEYRTDGKRHYTDDGFDGTIMVYRLKEFLFSPVPPPAGVARRALDYKAMQLLDVVTDCVMYQFYVTPSVPQASPKEVYCLTPGTHDLTLHQTQNLSIRYRNFEPFQDKSLARTISISQGTTLRGRIKIEQVDESMPDDGAFNPPEGSSPVSPGPEWLATSSAEDTPTRKVAPVVTKAMRDARASGPALMLVLISRSGSVKDAEVRYAPAASIQSCLEAVRKWTYAPILRQGKAVETMTSAFINFNLTQ